MVNQDFRDLFAEFNARGVEFLVVEAHALAVHGHVRATKDLDVWVRADMENARRLLAALHEFGAPTDGLSVEDFSSPGLTFQIGIEPSESTSFPPSTESNLRRPGLTELLQCSVISPFSSCRERI